MIAAKTQTKHINVSWELDRMNSVSTIEELFSGKTLVDEYQESAEERLNKMLAEVWIVLEESTEQRWEVSEDVWLSMEMELAKMFHLDTKHVDDIKKDYA